MTKRTPQIISEMIRGCQNAICSFQNQPKHLGGNESLLSLGKMTFPEGPNPLPWPSVYHDEHPRPSQTQWTNGPWANEKLGPVKIGKTSHKLVASGSFEEGSLDETNGFKAPTKENIG